MMTLTHCVASLPLALVLPLSLGSSAGVVPGSGNELRFVHPTKTAMAVTGTETHDLLLQSLTTQFGEAEPVKQPTALRLRTRLDTAFAEEVDPLGHLRRRYLDLAGTIQIMDPASVDEAAGTWNGTEIELTSTLPGTGVAFVRAEGQPGGFGRHCDLGQLREPLLPRLAAPFDWSRLLPPPAADGSAASPELGDSWEIDAKDVEPLVSPGGFLAWRPSGDEADPQILRVFQGGVGGNLQLAFEGTVAGKASARLMTVGVDPDDGRYADIEVKFELTLKDSRDRLVEEQRLESMGEFDVDMLGADLEITLEGASSMRWSRDLNRPLRAITAARESVTMAVRALPPGSELVTQSISMSGSIASNLKFKDVALRPAKRASVK